MSENKANKDMIVYLRDIIKMLEEEGVMTRDMDIVTTSRIVGKPGEVGRSETGIDIKINLFRNKDY